MIDADVLQKRAGQGFRLLTGIVWTGVIVVGSIFFLLLFTAFGLLMFAIIATFLGTL